MENYIEVQRPRQGSQTVNELLLRAREKPKSLIIDDLAELKRLKAIQSRDRP